MKRSDDRILTTHTGSLPRPEDVAAALEGRDQREVQSDPVLAGRLTEAVGELVRKQYETGVDILNDGEASKVSYATYVIGRLTGFDGEPRPMRLQVEASTTFKEYYAANPTGGALVARPSCNGPIAWRGDAQVQADIANLKSALQGVDVTEAFMSAASPGVVWNFLENEYYPDDEAYVFAIAEAMKPEYKAIVDAGFVLQLDCPDLAMGWNRYVYANKTVDDFRSTAQMRVEALNSALEGIPADRVRLHLCWGNFEGPHVRDIPLASIWDIAVTANAEAFSFEGANPRHEHEWAIFKDAKLPEGKILIPGVLDSTSNFVEHPELIAQRLVRYASLVGRENVIAGTDCGFSTAARVRPMVHPTVTWAKFAAMTEGAQLASKQLWG